MTSHRADPFPISPTTVRMSEEYSSLSDEALVKMAQAGDREAFEMLCDRYLPHVYNRLRALVPPEAVEDVTQEVFVAAVRGLAQFRGHSLFRTWLAAIVRRKAADYYRRQSRRPQTLPLDGMTTNPAGTDRWEEHAMVRVLLQRLPVSYQEVLLLRFAEGLPFQQIAAVLGISLDAAKSRYRRAVAAMAREMNRAGEGDEQTTR